MIDPIESFFGPAKRLSLRGDERDAVRKALGECVRARPANRLQQGLDHADTLFGGAPALRLTPAEKRDGLAALRTHMASRPPRPAQRLDIYSWLRGLTSAAAGIATVTATVGGIAIAAEYAAPGDALYAVKVAVNDVAVSAYVQATGQSDKREELLLARRLGEVEILAYRGDEDAARAHFAAQQSRIAILVAQQPESRIVARQGVLEQRFGGEIAVAFQAPESAAEAPMMMQALPVDPPAELAQPYANPPAAARMAVDEAETARAVANDAEMGVMMDMALVQEAPPVEPVALLRKTLAPTLPAAGTGSTGSGATTSGGLLPSTPVR